MVEIENQWERDIKDKPELFNHVYHDTVPTDIFNWLKDTAWKKRRQQKMNAVNHLVGHLTEEYFIKSRDESLDLDDNFMRYQNFIEQAVWRDPLNKVWKENAILTENRNMVIDTSWVNFQKKHEFNPPHIHSGLYSWIIFVNVPYNIVDEENYFSAKHLTHTSKLYFAYPRPNFVGNKGDVELTILNVDKSYEGKIIVFPAQLTHGVHPFYTSDNYRITISGNLVFKV